MTCSSSLPITHKCAIHALIAAYLNLMSQLTAIPALCQHVDQVSSTIQLHRAKNCRNNIVVGWLSVKSSSYFYSKKYLKHFITKLIAIDLKLQAKLKISIMIPPTMRPSAAWGSQRWTTRGGLERYFWVTGQGRKPRPGLGSLPWPASLWAPSPELPAEDLPALEAQDGPPPRAPGCWGPQSGQNHNWNFKFHLQFQINRNRSNTASR